MLKQKNFMIFIAGLQCILIYTGTIRHAYDYRYMYEIGVPWLHRRCFLPYWAYM